MKRFLAVYTGTHDAQRRPVWDGMRCPRPSARRCRPPASRRATSGEWAHGAAIVDEGGPLGKALRASRDGIAPTRNTLTGHVVVEVESHEAAIRMFDGHPHCTIFPGDAVEVMECRPIPGQ